VNREEWLCEAAKTLSARRFGIAYHGIESYKFSVGFPNRKLRKGHRMWDYATTDEGIVHIYISPLVDNSVLALATVLHAVFTVSNLGTGRRNRMWLERNLVDVGFEQPFTQVVPGEPLMERLGAITDLPPYPNEAVVLAQSRTQANRQLKVVCRGGGVATSTEHPYLLPRHEAYIVRLSQKQLDRGAPLCGVCQSRMTQPNITQQPTENAPNN